MKKLIIIFIIMIFVFSQQVYASGDKNGNPGYTGDPTVEQPYTHHDVDAPLAHGR